LNRITFLFDALRLGDPGILREKRRISKVPIFIFAEIPPASRAARALVEAVMSWHVRLFRGTDFQDHNPTARGHPGFLAPSRDHRTTVAVSSSCFDFGLAFPKSQGLERKLKVRVRVNKDVFVLFKEISEENGKRG
jgi:hypothetical protein